MKKAQTTRMSASESSVTNQSGFCHHEEKEKLNKQKKQKHATKSKHQLSWKRNVFWSYEPNSKLFFNKKGIGTENQHHYNTKRH